MTDAPLPIFDGHNDALLRLASRPPGDQRTFLERSEAGHLDLPRAREGGFAGGMFALFVPSKPSASRSPSAPRAATRFPCPSRPSSPMRSARRLTLAANLFRIEAESDGRLKVVRTVSELRECLANGTLAAVLHIEGAEAIDPELDMLEVLYQAGLRSIGIVWSRPNAFGHGVPFRYPSSPDIGAGPDRCRRAPGPGLQPARHPDRRLAPQREGLLGRRPHLDARSWRPTRMPTPCARSRAT